MVVTSYKIAINNVVNKADHQGNINYRLIQELKVYHSPNRLLLTSIPLSPLQETFYLIASTNKLVELIT